MYSFDDDKVPQANPEMTTGPAREARLISHRSPETGIGPFDWVVSEHRRDRSRLADFHLRWVAGDSIQRY